MALVPTNTDGSFVPSFAITSINFGTPLITNPTPSHASTITPILDGSPTAPMNNMPAPGSSTCTCPQQPIIPFVVINDLGKAIALFLTIMAVPTLLVYCCMRSKPNVVNLKGISSPV